ncbi:MAG TPA: hypothetical protein GXZ32_02705, partial [Clostridiales bacterium]|nr:hypothetical protein [Clostridiales bacterium]
SDMVERLFKGYTEKDFKENKDKNLKPSEFAFLSQGSVKNIINETIDKVDVQEAIGAAIKQSVKSYSRDKNTAINVYKDFVCFIRGKYQIDIPIEFPPTFSSEFDRQMYLVKELHEKGRSVAYLEDKLWISDRTIEEDLAKLRSNDGISIMGQKLSVRGVERQKGKIEFESTVHPIFLALNLTQVVVMLQGLRHMVKDRVYREYALKLSANIWNELSDYARRRIKDVSDMLSLDLSWYEKLDRYSSDELFFTERECSYDEGPGNILDYLKNGKKCAIEYIGDDGESKILTNCIIKRYNQEKEEIEVISNGERYTISLNANVKAWHEAKFLY